MTWTVNINGHDNLSGDEKVAYENAMIEKARALAEELAAAEGGVVSTASATTNTTGSVNLLA
jgi:hypothetical protein